MLGEKMYVRCPADPQSVINPRVFVCGQIVKIDNFKKTVVVKIYDPFNYRLYFQSLPEGKFEYPADTVKHCMLFIGTNVLYEKRVCRIIAVQKVDSGYYFYHIQLSAYYVKVN